MNWTLHRLVALSAALAAPSHGASPHGTNDLRQANRAEVGLSPSPSDSAVYRILPSSRLEVTTGKAGLLSFAGHRHVIRAEAFTGQVVHYADAPARSHLEVEVDADKLKVLTPDDTVEIRKVTSSMRTEVLHVDQYPEITLVSKTVAPSADGFHVIAALTLVGQTREVPIDVSVNVSADTLRAKAKFSVKQTLFGIEPYRGGPGGTVRVADKVDFDIEVIALRVESNP